MAELAPGTPDMTGSSVARNASLLLGGGYLTDDRLQDRSRATVILCLRLPAGSNAVADDLADSRSSGGFMAKKPWIGSGAGQLGGGRCASRPDGQHVVRASATDEPYPGARPWTHVTTDRRASRARAALRRIMRHLPASEVGTNRRKTVVCVEDDPEMIDLVKHILARNSFNLVGALGGERALETVKEVAPDLVLLDLMMPQVSGWDVYQQLKGDDRTKDIPVIIVTVLDPYWSERQGLRPSDVDGYLLKPFLPHALVAEVNRALERRAEA